MRSSIISFVLINLLLGHSASAQHQDTSETVLFVDILINSEEKIYMQNEQVNQDMLSKWVRNFVNEQPPVKYDRVVYRIYADHRVPLGRISDVEGELIQGYGFQVSVQKYLIDTQELEIDGENYIQKLNNLELKAID